MSTNIINTINEQFTIQMHELVTLLTNNSQQFSTNLAIMEDTLRVDIKDS